MKIVLAKNRQVITYNDNSVFLNNKCISHFSKSNVTLMPTKESICDISIINGTMYGTALFKENLDIRIHPSDSSIRIASSNKIVATYHGSPNGAIAAYITYVYLKQRAIKSAASRQNSVVYPKSSAEEQKVNTTVSSKDVTYTKALNQSNQNVAPTRSTPKSEEPRKCEYKEPNLAPADYQPYNNQKQGSVDAILLFAILAIFFVIGAICLIPYAWSTLPAYIAKGDIGVIMAFFFPLIGAIISVVFCIKSKPDKMLSCFKLFFAICIVGIIISSLLLMADVYQGNCEITGLILLDIPLSILAVTVGFFEFVLPISIVLCIIFTIIIKSRD